MKTVAEIWMDMLLRGGHSALPQRQGGVLWGDGTLAGIPVRLVAVVQNTNDPFPRARYGEVGLLQGWTLAHCLRSVLGEGAASTRRAVVALVDVPSQAYGRREEALCLSLALAAAVDAYAALREAGHALVALLVGNAMSGGFLAHGYQAAKLLALDDAGVRVQAMSISAALRVTRRDAEEWSAAAERIPPIGYDLASFRKLGILDGVVACSNRLMPSERDIELTRAALAQAIAEANEIRYLGSRLEGEGGSTLRSLSLQVRDAMLAQWDGEH